MTRSIHMTERGRFVVSDDPTGVIATAVTIALAPQHRDEWHAALSPDGDGLQIQGIGGVLRALDREDLPYPFQDDPALDPDRQELWRILRERDATYGDAAWGVIEGGELRALVQRGSELREGATP